MVSPKEAPTGFKSTNNTCSSSSEIVSSIVLNLIFLMYSPSSKLNVYVIPGISSYISFCAISALFIVSWSASRHVARSETVPVKVSLAARRPLPPTLS